MLGTKLGSYEILREIGKGGMAVVYRAHQPSMGRDVAIKVMFKSICDDANAVQRFQREARIVARLEHPHILPVYDFDGTHDPPYLVMRYLDSGTLKDVLRLRRQLPFEAVSLLLDQIASALDYAHKQGVVHRDIKPANIMLDREGNAIVSDFGIARMITATADQQLTASGFSAGSPAYMSPEQAAGEVDYRSDIYALGVVLFEILTGSLPYVANNAMGVMMMHFQEPVPSALARNPALPPGIDAVITQAMAKEPEDRYQSTVALAQAVGMLVGGPSTSQLHLRQLIKESAQVRRVTAPLTDTLTPSEQNKTVTVLCANAAVYVQVVEEASGGEAARQAIAALWSAAAQVVSEQHGLLLKQDESELMAVWGAETAHEDDAKRAIHAALALQAVLHVQGAAWLAEDEPLPLSLGLNTGVVLLTPGQRKGEYSASGSAITLAGRLSQQAEGAILIAHDTYNQVRGMFDMEADVPLKTRNARAPVPVYRVLGAKALTFRVNVHGVEGVETQMVGRESELKILQNAFLDAFEDCETHAITIVGEAGLGKSRLLYEFNNWSELRPERFWWLRGRATPEMSSRPYALLRDVISARCKILDSDSPGVVRQKLEDSLRQQIGPADEIAHMMGYLAGFDFTDSPFVHPLSDDPQQLAQRGRLLSGRWIAKLCASSPVVIEVEDIHHADNASLDLINTLASENAALPLLLICTARPVLYENRPAWGSGQPLHKRVTLAPLDKRSGRALAQELLKKVADVPKALRDALVERAEGNPYYMEELVKMLIDERVIIKESADVWQVEADRLGRLSVPTTLAGLLQARLDSLFYPERLTLQRAAVVGQTFFDGVLVAIDAADDTHVEDVSGILKRLVKREFIQVRETSDWNGSTQYVFGSQLLRDTLLAMLVRRQVQTYNRACAEWLIGMAGDRVDEYSGLIAEYYEKAGENERAAHYLRRGGEKALTIGVSREAAGLFKQALDLLPAESCDRVGVTIRIGQAQLGLGDYVQACQWLEEGLALARKLGDMGSCAEALAYLSQIARQRGDWDEARARSAEGINLARQSGDQAKLVRALLSTGWTDYGRGAYSESQARLEEGLALARELGNRREQARALITLGAVAQMLGELEESQTLRLEGLALFREVGDRRGEASALGHLGETARQQGAYAAAKSYYLESLALFNETDDRLGSAIILGDLGHATSALADDVAARAYYSEAMREALSIGAIPSVLDSLAGLASVQERNGQAEQALEFLGLAMKHASFSNDTRQQFVEPTLARLRAALPVEVVEAGLARGQASDLDEVVQRVLDDLRGAGTQ